MDYNEFSKAELTGLLDIIQSSVASTSEKDLVEVAGKIKDLVCADMCVCALGESGTGTLIKVVNHNWPEEWARMYMGEELYKQDPVIKFNYEHYTAHTWTQALKRYPEKTCTDLMNRASEFRLRYGISSGISNDGAKGSIFSFAGDRDRFSRHHLKVLDILTPHIHQALVRISGAARKACADLSAREMEVLAWMKEGKTNWEISVILNISERTVKFHVQNIERKLNAVNKAHAIAIAIDNGLVA